MLVIERSETEAMARPADGSSTERSQLAMSRTVSDRDKMIAFKSVGPDARNRVAQALLQPFF